MKKIVRLTESDLARIVKKVLKEDWSPVDLLRGGGSSDETVKKFVNACVTDKTPISARSNRLADQIRKSVQGTGTDEKMLSSVINSISSWSEFCSVVKSYEETYSVSLYNDLDSDIDSEQEWSQISIPIRNLLLKHRDSLKGTQTTGQTNSQTAGIPATFGDPRKFPCLATFKYFKKGNAMCDKNNCFYNNGRYFNRSTNQMGNFKCMQNRINMMPDNRPGGATSTGVASGVRPQQQSNRPTSQERQSNRPTSQERQSSI